MKINPKIYQQLTDEPFEIQEINGKKVEFHYMDQTPFLLQYAGRGRFAIWTSDGKDYKVLIESTYYEALKPFYQHDVNTIWMGFLEKISAISKKMNLMFVLPTLLLYVIGAIISFIFFKDHVLTILLALIVVVFVSNIFQGRIVNQKVKMENQKTQDEIRKYLGKEVFEGLIKAQEEHYQQYFKFDEIEETDEIAPEEVEATIEEKEEVDLNDKQSD